MTNSFFFRQVNKENQIAEETDTEFKSQKELIIFKNSNEKTNFNKTVKSSFTFMPSCIKSAKNSPRSNIKKIIIDTRDTDIFKNLSISKKRFQIEDILELNDKNFATTYTALYPSQCKKQSA